jgi:hypothetical protein
MGPGAYASADVLHEKLRRCQLPRLPGGKPGPDGYSRSTSPPAPASNYFSGAFSSLTWVISQGSGWAAAHAALGLALGLAALGSLALTWRRRGGLATVASVLGALAIIGAGFNGVSFLNYGRAFSSMIMAGLWALALACYLTGAFLAVNRIAACR